MNFVERLKKHEGFREHIYIDSIGVLTIGYGFNLETVSLPRPVAELWLAFEIDKKEDALEKFDWYNDTDAVRQEVLLDMAYNLGVNGLLTFRKMIKALENRNYMEAAAEMLNSKWARQVGQRAVRLSELMAGLN